MSNNILEVSGLTKQFGSLTAVNQLDFEIPQGAIFGLLGPNGSGKSTTLGMLLGVLSPSSGSYNWTFQENQTHVRRQIGTLLEQPNFIKNLSAYDNLLICATIKGVDKSDIYRVLKIVGLDQRAKSKFGTYSTGMKMRLGIANVLLGDPKILILDEPTNGLDPIGIAEVRQLILFLQSQGKTILLASHLLDEVEKVCSHMMILERGVKKYFGSVQNFVSGGRTSMFYHIQADDMIQLANTLTNLDFVISIHDDEGKNVIETQKDISASEVNRALAEQGIYLNHLSEYTPSLEQQFINLTKNKA
ncbi:MAG: ATP-binding cassette domain-containing protein [Bacteroidota bacterium]|nr:ATP-binding cassette domain-containing protein [Bacteroidota bacterium]